MRAVLVLASLLVLSTSASSQQKAAFREGYAGTALFLSGYSREKTLMPGRTCVRGKIMHGTFVTRKDLSVIPRIKANIPYSCSNLGSSWYKPNCPTPEPR